VACKAENRVPLGVFRTWVKSVELGRFPSTTRYFQVTRCNHCDNPPCVTICPVGAMYRRSDAIVDFDPSRCIGCRACQQACPYDAIYVDPDRRTAAKCNFCAHRIEAGMLPACVVACPEQAIVAGDMDDPGSEISSILLREQVRVRRPEYGTQPKVFYVDAQDAAIVPGGARNVGAYLFATANTGMHGSSLQQAGLQRANPERALAAPPAIVTYDVEHERPWGWQVPAYFWTKSVSAGVLVVPVLARLVQGVVIARRLELSACVTALVFMAATVGLLVSDLARPERFLRVVLVPQRRSWVARGAFCLIAYSALCAGLCCSAAVGARGLSSALLWPTVLAGLLASAYTAFLFGQCRGRDLWQTRLLVVHLVAQCVLASGAFLALVPPGLGLTARLRHAGVIGLGAGVLLHALVVLGELAGPRSGRHASRGARQASGLMTSGPLGPVFWGGAIGLGCAAPVVLLALSTTSAVLVGIAGACALAGLLAYEWCFVMAGQAVTNS
jgi:Fe-S-cluster-containing dehydrogenase component/formate-dependent nitrite reductase membrane component NrfD